jgi:hypothetical protein
MLAARLFLMAERRLHVPVALAVLCGVVSPLYARTPPDSLPVDGTRLAIVGGTVAAGVTAIHLYQQNAWWKNNRTSFHVREELVYARNIDKLGHFYGSAFMTTLFSHSLRWAHVPVGESLTWGAVGSTLFQTYIEIEDGFSVHWGFDRVDFAANLLGAWYPVAQHHVPALRNFDMRFSYYPKNPGEPGPIPGQTKTVFDDYEGQTLWLTAKMENLLPDGLRSAWPDFLCLSVGVAVRDNLSPHRYLAWYIAPDLDMTKILPAGSGFLATLAELLNYVHFPMPAVRFAPNALWYGIYF